MSRDMAASIVDTIGDTPLLDLREFVAARGLQGRLLVKLEYFNPGFSKKDRIALEIVREARRQGTLAPGQPVAELTSGNTGTGLAIVCRAFGHPFIAVMSRGNTRERARQMAALGAEVVLVDQATGSLPNQVSGEDLALVELRVRELTRQRGAFRADQFHAESNVLAHQRGTGSEIWRQSGGHLDAYLDFVGTGGTFTGVMRALRAVKSDVRGYVVEPAAAAVLGGRPVNNPNHKIQGGGYSMSELPLLDRALVTDYLQVSDQQAIEAAQALAREAGVFAGFSTGANVAAGLELLAGPERGATIALLAADSGLKYLSTDLFPDLQTP